MMLTSYKLIGWSDKGKAGCRWGIYRVIQKSPSACNNCVPHSERTVTTWHKWLKEDSGQGRGNVSRAQGLLGHPVLLKEVGREVAGWIILVQFRANVGLL
jgi:hypothetical protein